MQVHLLLHGRQIDDAERSHLRDIGEFKNVNATPKGVLLGDTEWAKVKSDYLPSSQDGDFIASLMTPVSEPGKFAGWIAPPKVGIDNKPGEFEYVKIAA